MEPAVTAALITAAVTVILALGGWLGRLLVRIDRRTKRVDDEIDHLHRTVYGDPERDGDGGLVADVATNSARLGTAGADHLRTDGGTDE